jgi:hypothetical protein
MMRILGRVLLLGGLVLSISGFGATLAVGQSGRPISVWPGPNGWCPRDYVLPPGGQRCWLVKILPDSYGACPAGYYRPPGAAHCWRNGFAP